MSGEIYYFNDINESRTSAPQDYLKGPFSILFDKGNPAYTYGSEDYLMRNLLTEEDMEANYSKLDKKALIIWQILSEEFIRKHIHDLDLILLARYQVLSEDFIRTYCMPLAANPNMSTYFARLIYNILRYQSLSMEFIVEFLPTIIHSGTKIHPVNLVTTLKYQELDEETIRFFLTEYKCNKFYNLICRIICHFQKLSEDIVREFPHLIHDHMCKKYLYTYQCFSKEFYDEFGLPICNGSVNKPEFWKHYIIGTGKFECGSDSFYLYKVVRADGYSVYNYHFKFEEGGTYETFSDYSYDKHSFGFEGSTFKGMKYDKIRTYNNAPKFKIIKIKVNYADVTYIGELNLLYHDISIRFNKFEVVEFNETEGLLTEKLMEELKNSDFNIVAIHEPECITPPPHKHHPHKPHNDDLLKPITEMNPNMIEF